MSPAPTLPPRPEALRAVADLREVAGLLAGQGRAADRVAARIRAGLAGAARGLSWEAALDLAPGSPDETPWYRAAVAEDVRAGLIAELLAGLSGSHSAKAKRLAALAQDYACRRWPRLRDLAAPPRGDVGTPAELLWRLHACGARWPLGWRQIVRRCCSDDKDRGALGWE